MKKKVLIIGLTERMGGVETFIYNTTRFSNKEKYDYDFLIHGTDEAIFQNEINKFYGDGEKRFYFVPSFKKNPIASYKVLKKFYAQNGQKYDYVHLETGAASEIVYVFPFSLKYNFKVISHSHNGNGYSPIINSIFKPIVNKVSDIELSCSDEATDWLFGPNRRSKVKIINNGIDTNRFTYSDKQRKRIRGNYSIPEDTLVIGHIGRFSEQKNHVFILEIFKEVVKRNKNVKLFLVGTGELKKEIENKAKMMNIEDKIIFCGVQEKTEEFYSAFDIFLMPSLYEGLPVVGVEAQSEGLPCYFSNNISSQIKITDNANIISLEKGASYWAEKIINDNKMLSQDRSKYSKIVSKAGYSIFGTVKELEGVYGVED